MKFVVVNDELPKKRARNEMRDLLNEFMNMGVKVVKIENHGYKTSKLAYLAFRRARDRHAFPIDVTTRNKEVYLIRRDI